MERRIAGKIDGYTIGFKDYVSSKVRELNAAVASILTKQQPSSDPQQQQPQVDALCKQLISSVYDYEKLKLTKEDFMKRKRVKNIVPSQQRCHAKRANGEQCTRKKKMGCDYCGTHTKGSPSSIIDHETSGDSSVSKVSQQSVNVWVQNIKGIEYFIDSNNNVYKHEDVIENVPNPQVIAKCLKNESSGQYSIEFI